MQLISRSGLLWPVLVAIACAEGETLTDDGGGAGKGGSSAGGEASFGGSTSGGTLGSGGKSSSGGVSSGGAKASGGASNGGAKASGGTSSGGATGGSDTVFTGAPSCNGPQGGTGGAAAGTGPGGATSGGTSSAGASSGGDSSGGVGVVGGAGGVSGGGAGGDGGAVAASFAAPAGGAAGSASAGATGSAGAGGSGIPAAFCDDFEDGDAGGWTPESGSWAITRDDSLTLEGGPTGSMAIAGDTVFADQIVEARVKVLSFPSSSTSYRAGLIARYTGGTKFYSLSLLGNGKLRVLHGNSTVSGCSDFAANVVAGTWYTLRFEVTGPANSTKLSAFIDGKPAQSCTLTSNTEVSGSAGVFTYGDDTSALFDQVLVYAP